MKSLFICDLQPEYSRNRHYGMTKSIPVDTTWQWIRRNAYHYDRVVTFYNGECVGITDQDVYVNFLLEKGLITENTYCKMKFFDKGYAYIFDMMDDEQQEFTAKDKQLIDTIKSAHNNIIYNPAIDDDIYLPEVCEFLSSQYFGNITLIGGSGLACLKELAIFIKAKAKHKRLTLLHDLIYI